MIGILLAVLLGLSLLAGCGSDKPPDDAVYDAVPWVNAYTGEKGMLYINAADAQGVRYILESAGETYEGVAAISPGDFCVAQDEVFQFQIDIATATVYITGQGFDFAPFVKLDDGVG